MMNGQRSPPQALNLDQRGDALRKAGRHEKTTAGSETEQAAPGVRSRRQNADGLLVALQHHLLQGKAAQSGAIDIRTGGQAAGPDAGIAAVPATVGEPVIPSGMFTEQPRCLVRKSQPRGPDSVERPAVGNPEDPAVEGVNAHVAVGRTDSRKSEWIHSVERGNLGIAGPGDGPEAARGSIGTAILRHVSRRVPVLAGRAGQVGEDLCTSLA